MMPVEIPWETRFEAEDLYITGGCTYEEVARRTGVSVSQLKRWGKEGNWKEAKKEMLESLSAIKQNTVKLRLGLIEAAMKEHNPMQVFAAEKFEALALKEREFKQSEVVNEVDISERHFETPGEAIEALEDALQQKINKMVSVSGELNGKAIEDLDKAWKVLSKLRAKYKPSSKEEIKQGGLSDEAAESIRKQILGII